MHRTAHAAATALGLAARHCLQAGRFGSCCTHLPPSLSQTQALGSHTHCSHRQTPPPARPQSPNKSATRSRTCNRARAVPVGTVCDGLGAAADADAEVPLPAADAMSGRCAIDAAPAGEPDVAFSAQQSLSASGSLGVGISIGTAAAAGTAGSAAASQRWPDGEVASGTVAALAAAACTATSQAASSSGSATHWRPRLPASA